MLAVRAAQDTVSVPISLTEVEMRATVRLVLAPLVTKFPCFGSISIAMMKRPQVSFDLRVVGGDITLVPGAATLLTEYLKGLIAAYLVWPRRITVGIPGTGYIPAKQQGKIQLRTGTLRVKLINVTDLNLTPETAESEADAEEQLFDSKEDEKDPKKKR